MVCIHLSYNVKSQQPAAKRTTLPPPAVRQRAAIPNLTSDNG
jgi:hypothetical protein